MVPKLNVKVPWSTAANSQECPGFTFLRETEQHWTPIRYHVNYQLRVVHNFNFRSCTFFSKTHLCDADFLVGSCCDKNNYHVKINMENKMSMEASNLIPRYEKLGSANRHLHPISKWLWLHKNEIKLLLLLLMYMYCFFKQLLSC